VLTKDRIASGVVWLVSFLLVGVSVVVSAFRSSSVTSLSSDQRSFNSMMIFAVNSLAAEPLNIYCQYSWHTCSCHDMFPTQIMQKGLCTTKLYKLWCIFNHNCTSYNLHSNNWTSYNLWPLHYRCHLNHFTISSLFKTEILLIFDLIYICVCEP
jgi:hypothetical protein